MAPTEQFCGSGMDGFIIETTCEGEGPQGGRRKVRWIGIMQSAKDFIAVLPGHSPSAVDRGPGVLWRAHVLGLTDGEFQEFDAS